MAARIKGLLAVMGTGRNRLGEDKEAGGGYNDDIGVGIGVGRGIERKLGQRGGVSGSEQVEWSGMAWGERVKHLDRQRSGYTAGGGDVVSKT